MAAEPPPSGTVTISSKSVALGIGVSWGDGTLTMGGKTYPFSVEGLSVADPGRLERFDVGRSLQPEERCRFQRQLCRR